MIAAIQDPNPVVFIDERLLYGHIGPVPEEIYHVEIGKGSIRRVGKDVTVVAVSLMVHEAMKAAEELASNGVDVEVIDLRTVKPLDRELILASVRKTGRLVVADVGWQSFGVSAEISALTAASAFDALKSPIVRVALPDCPAPASKALEDAYYPGAKDIVKAIQKISR
jgi:pyruvate dehydrogenase E1 component beta subunit